jgi:membrane-bound lytic murein transglycosylase MltF
MMHKYVFPSVLLILIFIAGLVFSDSAQKSQAQLDKEFREELRNSLQLATSIVEPQMHDLPDMLKAKRIRVLTTYTFTNYFIHQGQAHGFEHSQMEEFRKFLTKEQKRNEIQIDFIYLPVPYDILIEALNRGFGDIVAANLTITPGRSQEVDFTDPYLWGIKEILVSQKKGAKIDKLEDLSGKQVHVRKGSSYEVSLQGLNKEFAANKLKPIQIETFPGLFRTEDILEMVNTGLIDFTLADSHLATLASEVFANIKVNEKIVFNSDVRFGWMVRKNNPKLKANLNQFISTVKKGTLLGNMFYKRYFKQNPWLRKGLTGEDLKRLEYYRQIFKKYADKYDFDWLLLAAQAYQESRFEPNTRSPAGAVGLMQLLPSTGKDMGFNDIKSPENNVHAGAKYMRWIMDNYFNETDISEDDRMRFALAAYNAGPTNIQRSRTRTAEMGNNEKQWFNHTELGTMRQVGLEPVHYVRNINKYYLSFRIATVTRDLKESATKKK